MLTTVHRALVATVVFFLAFVVVCPVTPTPVAMPSAKSSIISTQQIGLPFVALLASTPHALSQAQCSMKPEVSTTATLPWAVVLAGSFILRC